MIVGKFKVTFDCREVWSHFWLLGSVKSPLIVGKCEVTPDCWEVWIHLWLLGNVKSPLIVGKCEVTFDCWEVWSRLWMLGSVKSPLIVGKCEVNFDCWEMWSCLWLLGIVKSFLFVGKCEVTFDCWEMWSRLWLLESVKSHLNIGKCKVTLEVLSYLINDSNQTWRWKIREILRFSHRLSKFFRSQLLQQNRLKLNDWGRIFSSGTLFLHFKIYFVFITNKLWSLVRDGSCEGTSTSFVYRKSFSNSKDKIYIRVLLRPNEYSPTGVTGYPQFSRTLWTKIFEMWIIF